MDGEGQDPEVVPEADEHEQGHQGSFATGQEAVEHHPELEEEEGDFATGEELAKPVHEGSFAEGEEDEEHHPETPGFKGDFAEGQEEERAHPG
jgi:hypothetical protein